MQQMNFIWTETPKWRSGTLGITHTAHPFFWGFALIIQTISQLWLMVWRNSAGFSMSHRSKNAVRSQSGCKEKAMYSDSLKLLKSALPLLLLHQNNFASSAVSYHVLWRRQRGLQANCSTCMHEPTHSILERFKDKERVRERDLGDRSSCCCVSWHTCPHIAKQPQFCGCLMFYRDKDGCTSPSCKLQALQ